MSVNAPPFSACDVLTVEEFAARLKVSRTTVFGWLKKGDLREGVHYLRLGRILRFRWPIFNSQEPEPVPGSAVDLQPAQPEPPPSRKCHRRPKGTHPAINLDY
jgi:excisionase family DNA binding protein